MKNTFKLFASLCLSFALAACGGEQKAQSENQNNTKAPAALMSNQNQTDSAEETAPKSTKKAKKEITLPENFKPIDVNTATAEQLIATLKGTGVGKAKVEKIIEYRQQNNGFKSIDELTQVKGIGDKILEKIRPRLTISGSNQNTTNTNKKAKPTTTQNQNNDNSDE